MNYSNAILVERLQLAAKSAIAKGEGVLSELLVNAVKVIVKQDKLLAAAGLAE